MESPKDNDAEKLRKSQRKREKFNPSLPVGAFEEHVEGQKRSRSSAKMNLTKKMNELEHLMINKENIDEVRSKITDLYSLMENFRVSHEKYHSCLKDEDEIQSSLLYYKQQEQYVSQFYQAIDDWIADIECMVRADLPFITPLDSVSNIGSRAKSSRSSKASSRRSSSSRLSSASSAASGKLKAAAKKAALEAQAASLKSLQLLKREELELKLKQEELRLKTEIAVAEAEERIFSEAQALESDEISPQAEHATSSVVSAPAQSQQLTLCSNNFESGIGLKSSALGGEAKESVDPNQGVQAPSSDSNVNKVSEVQIKSEGSFQNMLDFQRQQNEQFMMMQNKQNEQIQKLLLQQQQHTLALTLPQPEVPTFSGDPADYCAFIRAFENLIEAKTLSDSARLYYLVQYTKGDVQELMKSCLLIKNKGYEEAKRLLKSKYGQSHKIATAYIEKVCKGPCIKSDDGPGLHKFAVSLTSCKNTLKDIGLLSKVENSDTMKKIVGRLPLNLKLKWRDEADRISEGLGREITFEDLANFVEKKARIATHPVFGKIDHEPRSSANSAAKPKLSSKPPKISVFACQGEQPETNSSSQRDVGSVLSSATSASKLECLICKGRHWLSQCDKFKEMSLQSRKKFVRDKGLCDNCLVAGHFVRSCEKKSFCRIPGCKLKHSTYLHPKSQQPENVAKLDDVVEAKNSCISSSKFANEVTGAGIPVLRSSTVGMAIAPVKVRARGQRSFVETYAFLDSGSNSTFCTESLQRQLGVTGMQTKLSLTTMERSNSTKECNAICLEVFDLDENESVELPLVYTTSSLPVTSQDIPRQEDVERWDHLAGVQLSSIQAEIGLLIGCDQPKALEPREVRESKNGGPFASRTMFGWVINGPLGNCKGSSSRTCNFVHADQQLHNQFQDFCNMEFNDSAFSSEPSMSREDIRALDIFKKSVQLTDGHYNIAIPWKNSNPSLPNNKSMAVHRLKYLKKKLVNDPELGCRYSSFMNDLLKKGFARKIPEEEIECDDGLVWYLPHHNVVNPQKPEKTRVVFDCAAKYRGTSLNDCVLQGPDLANNLVGVLTRFRKESVAFMADIESMFFQVRVSSNDTNALRFLWFPNNDFTQEPADYQMLVHLFGGVWSPSCANFALLKTAEDNSPFYDAQIVETVQKNFYVDDCLKSVESEEKAVELVGQLRSMLAEGGFNLTKFISNSRMVIQSVPVSDRAKEVKELDLYNDVLPIERALGVGWNTETDKFTFKIIVKDKPATRRGLLSIVSSIYDPLGFAAPFVLPAKFILQELCVRKLGWDDRVPDDLLARWDQWIRELPTLEKFDIDRCFTPPEFGSVVRRELHHFSDASDLGYGAVSYLRSIDNEGRIQRAFVQAKSRLAPMKKLTIPRLELAAAVVSSRLERMIRKELDLSIDESFFWTDSTCVLGYINNQERRFQTYVANRVSTILEVSRPSQWMYVNTKLNPADDASRGLNSQSLINNSRWKNGPEFLLQSKSAWPVQPESKTSISESDPELKKEMKSLAISSEKGTFNIASTFQRFSSWFKLRKFVAWIMRVQSIYKSSREKKNRNGSVSYKQRSLKPITVEELRKAEVEILKYVQKDAFKDELLALLNTASREKSVKKASSVYKLNPSMVNGLLCVGGRLNYASIPDGAKHQIILPKKHHVVGLIISHYHALTGHSGVEYVLSAIRSKFWIVKGRVAVKKILGNCFDCKKRQSPVGQQRMADLPKDRVTSDKPPFSYVGVDCFGPFVVRRGRSDVKRYGVIFTCLAIRAIHLEVAFSLDTDSFINALRRFISRRGNPERIRSDNGTNFVSGERELREAINQWNQEKIHNFLLQQNIEWVFNPPSASHFGGVWERCIRTVRKVVKAVVREQTLDDEGLSTLFCEVEAIINGRPLTKASDDPRDLEALTPNHLLLLRSGGVLPPGVFHPEDSFSRKRWKQVQYLADVFWRRWTREYLPSLQQRQKWNSSRRNFLVNDIVLIVDDNAPRGAWPLGRVLQTHQSAEDGLVRSVTVKTKSSILKRPIHKLVLLEEAHAEE